MDLLWIGVHLNSENRQKIHHVVGIFSEEVCCNNIFRSYSLELKRIFPRVSSLIFLKRTVSVQSTDHQTALEVCGAEIISKLFSYRLTQFIVAFTDYPPTTLLPEIVAVSMDSGNMKLVSLREEDILSVVQVISAMSDPFVDNARRMEAYHSFEIIKKNLSVDHKLEIGSVLARNASGRWNLAIVHVGFQFLEDSVKFNWQQMKPEQKLLTKNTVFDLIIDIDTSGQSTESFVLDGIGKIVVEMIKREWPQQWPTMLQEVEELSMKGPTQLQIIILVFLRYVMLDFFIVFAALSFPVCFFHAGL